MRLLVLLLLASVSSASEVPMLIPLGVAELTVQPGTAASMLLAQERHQRGLETLRTGQGQDTPLEVIVLLRVNGGTATITVRQAAGAPLAAQVVAAGDGLLRLRPAAAGDLMLEATTEGAVAVQVTAVAYGEFLQAGIMDALVGNAGAPVDAEEAAAEKDPALAPFLTEARNLKQILTAMVAFQGDAQAWPVVDVAGLPVPPQSPEQARLLTAAAFELVARRMQLPSRLFVSPFSSSERVLPAPRSEAEITARPDPAWAVDYAYDWAVPMAAASYRVVVASRHFVRHPRLGQGVTVACADTSTRFLAVAKQVEVNGTSTAGLSGFGDDLLPAVPNPEAAGTLDHEHADPGKPALPDNIFDDHGDGEAGGASMPGRGDPRRAFVK